MCRVFSFDRLVPPLYNRKQRLEIAKAFLALYQSAFCIVTNKMHVALPALALETPVLLIDIDPDDLINDPERFDGLVTYCFGCYFATAGRTAQPRFSPSISCSDEEQDGK